MATANMLPSVPQILKDLPNWVSWKLIPGDDGKPTKVPFISGTNFGKKAKSSDSSTWTDFKTAVTSTEVNHTQGVGFVVGGLALAVGLVGVDIDGCRDPETGDIAEWADEIVQQLNSYSEITPSGTGVRVWVISKLPSDEKVFKLDPSIGHAEKVQIEVYDRARYFTITGDSLFEEAGGIEARDLAPVYELFRGLKKRFTKTVDPAGAATATAATSHESVQVQKSGTAITDKLELLMHGVASGDKPFVLSDASGNSVTYQDRSAADMALCNLLALKYGNNPDAIWNDYLESALARPKWENREDDFRKGAIAKAIRWAEAERKKTSTPLPVGIAAVNSAATPRAVGYAPLEFKYPPVLGTEFDFVLDAANPNTEGWFPRGDPSLIGGPSGGSKTTLMLDLLETQLKGQDYLGHRTFRLPYVVIGVDRGKNAQKRTAKRMQYEMGSVPTRLLPPGLTGDAALHGILNEIEGMNPLPAVVFLEGCDLLLEDASKMHIVAPFLSGLQKIAKHYHIAIICSLGTPKMKKGEGYEATRDKIYGTVAWGRMTETILLMSFEDGDDTKPRRSLIVQLRNGPTEKYDLEMSNGRLVTVKPDPVGTVKVRVDMAWMEMQGDWFTAADLAKAVHYGVRRAEQVTADAWTKRFLKSRKKKVGEVRMFRWNNRRGQPDDADDPSPEEIEAAKMRATKLETKAATAEAKAAEKAAAERKRILQLAKKKGESGITKTDVHELFNRNRTTEQVQEHLDALTQTEQLIPKDEKFVFANS